MAKAKVLKFRSTSQREFLSWDLDDQEEWISENIPDFEERLYGEGYLGCSYPIEKIDLKEYRYYAEDYGTADLIARQGRPMSDERVDEIDAGEELSDEEIESLFAAISENDIDGWTSHHGFPINLKGGSIFVYFFGYGMGQGGIEFTYSGAFSSRDELVESLSDEYSLALEDEPKKKLPDWLVFLLKALVGIAVFILFIVGSVLFFDEPNDEEWIEHCKINYPTETYDECRKLSGEGGW
jgi:hypothetical protein